MNALPTLPELQTLLAEEMARAEVAGAVLALGVDDAPVRIAAHGWLDARTREPVRPDSLFEIGSLTKVPVAAIALQLAAEGRLDPDRPVREAVPGFAVADRDAAARITLRQLLSHTSGIDGDFFFDPGEGPEALERFARACAGLPQLFAPGAGVSYCNAGYALVGWLVERILRRPFAEVFEERLGALLGAHSLRIERRGEHRPNRAEGHAADAAGGGLAPLPRHLPPYAHAPAGARTSGNVGDVVRLARLHLRADPRLLPREWIAEMQRPQALAPAGDWEYGGRGLGWELFGAAPAFLPGHDGATPGQAAFLRLVPARGLVIAAMATGPGARRLFRALARRILPQEPALSAAPPPPAAGVATAPLAGRYACRARLLEVFEDAGALHLRVAPHEDSSGLVKPARARLVPAGPALMLRHDAGADTPQPLVFVDFDAAGRPRGAYAGQRLHLRLDAARSDPPTREMP